MNKEIDISNVPLTPRGENHDFNSVINYEFVRFDEEIKVRTTSLIFSDEFVSDNEVDINTIDDVKERVKVIVNSPMVEVRKKRESFPSYYTRDGEIRLNPKREDFLITSAGCYENYAQGRRKTIAVMNQVSSSPNERLTRKNSLPNVDCATIEQVTSENKENVTDGINLDLLVSAICDSQTMLEIERKRLNDLISDWKYILLMEYKEIPQESEDEIRSFVGRLQILLDNRFKSTEELLRLAEEFVNNEGVKVNEDDKEYRPDDIYAFVDLLIKEIKNFTVEFDKLHSRRNNNWVEIAVEKVQPVTVLKKKKPIAKNAVKCRIDVSSLRRKYAVQNNTPRSTRSSISLRNSITPVTEADIIDDSTGKQTPVSGIKRGVRNKAVIKTMTGTPLHSDTPRPRRSAKISVSSQFAIPNANIVVSKKRSATKRSITQSSFASNSEFQSPNFMPKNPRRSRDKKK